MAVGVIQYQKPEEKKEDKSFLAQIEKPLSIAQSVGSIYSNVKGTPEKTTETPETPKPTEQTSAVDQSRAINRKLSRSQSWA